jgi:hypothetical protein
VIQYLVEGNWLAVITNISFPCYIVAACEKSWSSNVQELLSLERWVREVSGSFRTIFLCTYWPFNGRSTYSKAASSRGSILVRSKRVFSFHSVQICSRAQPASYTMDDDGALSPGIKRPGREAEHSSPINVKIKNGRYTSLFSHMYLWLEMSRAYSTNGGEEECI